MAKSLSRILDQINRLQKEADSIQQEVIARVRKEIAKYGLTAEQLFGASSARRGAKAKAEGAKPAKYGDGQGNTWGGMGKRPDWLRQALAAGKALEDFLLDAVGAAKPAAAKRGRKPAASAVAKAPAKKRAARKSVAPAADQPAKGVRRGGGARALASGVAKKAVARKSPAKGRAKAPKAAEAAAVAAD